MKMERHDFICSECGRYFGSKINLFALHMRLNHGIEIIEMPTEGEEYQRVNADLSSIKSSPKSLSQKK